MELQKKTGIEGLKRTTAHEPDYDKLMRYRINLLREHNIRISDTRQNVERRTWGVGRMLKSTPPCWLITNAPT